MSYIKIKNISEAPPEFDNLKIQMNVHMNGYEYLDYI